MRKTHPLRDDEEEVDIRAVCGVSFNRGLDDSVDDPVEDTADDPDDDPPDDPEVKPPLFVAAAFGASFFVALTDFAASRDVAGLTSGMVPVGGLRATSCPPPVSLANV
jgi:hypothetical protein